MQAHSEDRTMIFQGKELKFKKNGMHSHSVRFLHSQGYRYCPECKTIKRIHDFYSKKSGQCKECNKARSRERSRKIREKLIEIKSIPKSVIPVSYEDIDRAREYRKIKNETPLKTCSCCHEKRESHWFYYAPPFPDSLYPICKVCMETGKDIT